MIKYLEEKYKKRVSVHILQSFEKRHEFSCHIVLLFIQISRMFVLMIKKSFKCFYLSILHFFFFSKQNFYRKTRDKYHETHTQTSI